MPASLAVSTRPSPAIIRTALRMFLEEVAQVQRNAAIGRLERKIARQVARWFVLQGKIVVAVLGEILGDRFDRNAEQTKLTESLSWEDWDYLINQILMGNHPGGLSSLRKILIDGVTTAFVAGADKLGPIMARYGIRFSVGSQEAIDYAARNAALRVTQINQTTRKELNSLLTDAVREGWSWQRTAKAIIEKYEHFAGAPLFPSKTYTSRAEMIAAYEIGDAYEAGNQSQAYRLALVTGLPLEKRWYTAQDERVRPAHVENAAAGYIPMEASFPGDGADRPPTDPGCRCSVGYRIAEGSP